MRTDAEHPWCSDPVIHSERINLRPPRKLTRLYHEEGRFSSNHLRSGCARPQPFFKSFDSSMLTHYLRGMRPSH